MKLLILNTLIFGAGDFVEENDRFVCGGIDYPKSVINGYEIHDVDVPEDFIITNYEWNGTNVVLRARTNEQNAYLAEQVRSQRNALLTSSDWTQIPDYPGSNKTAWAIYRQALRDLTKQSGFPLEVTWPDAP
jgi:hypothetical protein